MLQYSHCTFNQEHLKSGRFPSFNPIIKSNWLRNVKWREAKPFLQTTPAHFSDPRTRMFDERLCVWGQKNIHLEDRLVSARPLSCPIRWPWRFPHPICTLLYYPITIRMVFITNLMERQSTDGTDRRKGPQNPTLPSPVMALELRRWLRPPKVLVWCSSASWWPGTPFQWDTIYWTSGFWKQICSRIPSPWRCSNWRPSPSTRGRTLESRRLEMRLQAIQMSTQLYQLVRRWARNAIEL